MCQEGVTLTLIHNIIWSPVSVSDQKLYKETYIDLVTSQVIYISLYKFWSEHDRDMGEVSKCSPRQDA